RTGRRLARALGTGVGALLAAPEVRSPRTEALRTCSDYGHGVRRRDLAAVSENVDVAHYRLDAHSETSASAAHRSGSRESFFVLSGSIEIVTIDRRTTLHAGDCAQAPGDVPHQLANPHDRPAELMLIIVCGPEVLDPASLTLPAE